MNLKDKVVAADNLHSGEVEICSISGEDLNVPF